MTQIEKQEIDEIEAILFDIEQNSTTLSPTGFIIDSEDKATWAARKILRAEEQIAHKKQLAEEYKARIDFWLAQNIKQDVNSTDFLKGCLEPYAIAEIKKMRKGKTLHLLGANVAMRKQPDKTEITDEAVALRFCEKKLLKAIEVKKSFSKAVLKKALTDGVLIPGVELIQGKDTLSISASASVSAVRLGRTLTDVA